MSIVFPAYLEKYARLLVDYSVEVKRGDRVVIRTWLEALPLARLVYREVLRRGAHPALYLEDDILAEIFYREASDEQIDFVDALRRSIYTEFDVVITLFAPSHLKNLVSIPPEKQARRSKALEPYFTRFLQEAAEGKKRWVLAAYPTLAMAQEAGMTPIEFEEFVARAVKVTEDDPVAAWRRQAEYQRRIVDEILSKADELVFKGPGIDLTVKVGGRRWIVDDGHENMPGGEVFTGPVEDSVEGCVRFDFPSVYRGVEVEGVKLCFKRGEVVEYDAVKGRDFLAKMLSVDEGAKRLGELAFGLNYGITRATREILFDEKIGGTIHMALGNGYPETGSRNKSAIHWDLIKDMRDPEARVYADGELIYKAGRFLLEE
ncbi:aminopeptidase [Pyrolobus fumarii]|uniref:aminopeptidase n=1 Tax=Pyrolobus fumarii TaxID=54252 RepID=UPI000A42E8ED|nr:aminopeptidase [Pyrolobus fumarii]